jgi:hypothetical protein
MSSSGNRKAKRAAEPPRSSDTSSRRAFLRATAVVGGLGALGVELLGCGEGAPPVPDPTMRTDPSPGALVESRPRRLAHRAITPVGVLGYADRLSAAPGETIHFHVSSDVPYAMGIYRLGLDPDSPSGDVAMPEFLPVRVDAPVVQPIHPGSYVHIPKKLTRLDAPEALTVECWLRPRRSAKRAGLVTQFDFPARCGFGLFLLPGGRVELYVGDGGSFDAKNRVATPAGAVQPDVWSHVVGRWDGETMSIWIDGVQRAGKARLGAWSPGTEELRLAAHGADGVASQFLDGDLAMPALYSRALGPGEIAARAKDRAATLPAGHVLAVWPMNEEKGAVLADASAPDGRHGAIINHGTWQIGGPGFDSDVPQFPTPGSPGAYDPAKDRSRGHGLRFAADDLYDCQWNVTHAYVIPADARSGFYVARFRYSEDATDYYHITFVVRKQASRPKSDILLLTPTNTFIAYNSKPFCKKKPGFNQVYRSTHRNDDALQPDEPGYSAYAPHQSGLPAYNMGLRVPMPSFDPYNRYVIAGYGHLMQPVRATQTWLESSGYSYDVATDLDLHNNPDLLTGYKAVLIAGHSEYWSIPAYENLKRYLAARGNVLVLSGNTMFWRVSFNPSSTVMECRKSGFASAVRVPQGRGELWHSDDGQRGGLMRESGYPAYPVLGLETAVVLDPSYPASFTMIKEPAHFLFDGVDLSTFGVGLGGHETDCRISTMERARVDAGFAVPTDATAPTEIASSGLTLASATGGKPSAIYDFFGNELPIGPGVASRGDLLYWELPSGGRVVNVGSIRAGVALKTDASFATFVRNVLQHFEIPVPL